MNDIIEIMFLLLYYCTPYLLIIFFVVVPIIFAKRIIQKRYKTAAEIIIIWCLILFGVLHIDFIKSRKPVDMEWMIGKTMGQIQWRYASPPNEPKFEAYKVKVIDGKEYMLCIREIYRWNIYDGVQGQYIYNVLLDAEGKTVDVKRYDWGGYPPPHDYKERW